MFFWIVLILLNGNIVNASGVDASKPEIIVFKKTVLFSQNKEFNHEVIIYPGAFLWAKEGVQLKFNKPVTVFGNSHVFQEKLDVEFGSGTLSSLNPVWFGANGADDLDDTGPVLKVIEIARNYSGSINIIFPQGRFLISETLEIGNNVPSSKSINLLGQSMSANAQSGSSLLWIGPAGKSMIQLKNYCTSLIEQMDFGKGGDNLVKHNIEMLPFTYQISFKNCSFAGCGGPGSSNVNLNEGNNLQVSEISFENCTFRGHSDDGVVWQTESAITGGLANTKNFYFRYCSFVGYTVGGINIEVSDAVKIENCTFAHNTIDIICLLCNTLATSNYSENSKSFFRSTVSQNISFTTLMNNCFYGHVSEDYIITQGGGNLVLINNNFGGMGGTDLLNKISWDSGPFSSIHSVGNFFRNAPPQTNPFEFSGQTEILKAKTYGDLIGRTIADLKIVEFQGNNND